MAKDRPPSFQLYPADVLSSRAVVLMTPEARGGYFFLLCHAWDSDEPGVLPGVDAELAMLSGLRERWPACREMIAAAFDVHSREGFWVQVRMVRERCEQHARYASASCGGHATASKLTPAQRSNSARKAALARWSKRAFGAHSMRTPSSSSSSSVLESKAAAAAAHDETAGSPTAGDVRALVAGVAASMRLPGPDSPASPPRPLDAAWEWLKANASPERAAVEMRFVGWLVSTGTRDGGTLLALVKHKLVHGPANPHAYYTPLGNARQSIALRTAGDRAIAEHERLKREERAFLGKG